MEAEGCRKLGEAMAGSEVEGFYGFLRELLLIPSLSHLNLPPKSLTLPPMPPFPNHPLRIPRDLKSLILQTRLQDLPLQLHP